MCKTQLVLCGTDEVTYDDMKRHSKEDTSGSITSCNTLAWFWTIIRGFTKDEMAKLLQFTTGSSLLPSGGFKALDPPFTVILAPTRGGLPTAHTWLVTSHILSMNGSERSLIRPL